VGLRVSIRTIGANSLFAVIWSPNYLQVMPRLQSLGTGAQSR
jgi:hypothetical protein